jgi:hypothetical protein
MKITVWLATRDRTTWIAAAEITGLTLVLTTVESTWVRFAGLALLIHLGYRALTGLPIGSIPGRPDGAKQYRRNQDLRSRVVGFLNEVKRVEHFAQQARVGGLPRGELEQHLASGQVRVMAAAAEVAKVSGQFIPEPEPEAAAGPGADNWIRRLRVYEKVVRSPSI